MSERCTQPTRRGSQCRNWALPGSDRCRIHVAVPDPELVEQLLAMLRSGAYLDVACLAAGVQPGSTLAAELERARAEGEIRNVALVANAARQGNWGAAAWLLERQYPERWGRVARLAEPTVAPQPLTPALDGLDELAGRRATRRGELR